ncbi:MAG: SURF1 family protein [Candidatus Competibacteraceae bacterium]
MPLGRFTFKPALVPSLVTVVLLPILLSLGFWQLRRAHEKEALQMAFQAAVNASYTPIADLDPTAPETRYRGVIAPGRYDADHQILLDNQIQDGQPGYQVFTPLRPAGQTAAILVARGWVPLGPSRRQLPDLQVTTTPVTVRGRLSQPPSPGLRLAEPVGADSWPHVVQYIDYERLAQALGYPLLPVVLLLDPAAENGYRRDWRPQLGEFGPERHVGYAVQWFALAATLIVIYFVVNIKRLKT